MGRSNQVRVASRGCVVEAPGPRGTCLGFASGAARGVSLLPCMILAACMMTACSAPPPTTTPPVVVTVSPKTASVNISMMTSFTAQVQNGTQGTVTWQVNGTTGGTAATGTINVNGVYTAPAAIPSGGTVTIAAVSVDDKTKSDTAVLTILPPATVTVMPPTPTVAAGMTQTFTSTVTGAPSDGVTWEVDGIPGGFLTLGTISNTGVYTAPLSPPPGATVTITALSQADTTQSGSATTTLTFGTQSLQGPYAFTISGKNSAGMYSRAGSFVADGAGGIQGGLEDVNNAGVVATTQSFTGTFTVGVDGRGTLQFGDGLNPSIFRIALASNAQAQIISFDAAGTAIGEASLQDRSAFKATALNGTYVFDFFGQDSSGSAISEIGQFFADGQGGISLGLEDINDKGSLSQPTFTGTYSVPANSTTGRGAAQVVTSSGTFNYAFYMVSRGAAKFVSIDASPAPAVAGVLQQQLPGNHFSASTLNGTFGFLIAGANSAGDIATAGIFSPMGDGTLNAGVLDENNNGAVTPNQTFTGTYAVASSGRGTATFSATNRTYTFVFYLTAANNAVFQETDSAIVSDGAFTQQAAGPFTAASVQGNYAVGWGGAAAGTTQVIAGQFGLDASANVTAGSLDISTQPGTQTSAEAVTGTLTLGGAGRNVLTLNPATDNRNFAVYIISGTRMFSVGIDAGRLATGAMLKQF